MADKVPVKAIFSGSDVTSLGEFATGDTVPVANGGSGVTTLADLIALVGGATTGDFKHAMRASAPTGWITASGATTIGNVGSGATRANVDTLALFTLWWTNFNDALCPILTSAGGASTRGASAAADWAALKRLTVFDASDRVMRVPGGIQAAGAKLEATQVFDNTGNGVSVQAPYNVSTQNPDGSVSISMKYANIAPTTDSGPVALSFAKVRVASLGIPGFWKL